MVVQDTRTSIFARATARLPLLASCLIVIGGAACGGSELGGRVAEGIRTVVEPATIHAGEQATVRCELIGDHGYGDVEMTFSVEPGDAITTTGDAITTTVAGQYQVSCAALAFGLVDAEGATLEVLAAAPVEVTPVFGDNPITANERTSVECVSVDAYGNTVPVSAEVQADAPLVVSGGQIGGDTAGVFEVGCGPVEGLSVPHTPASLTVVPGPAAQVTLHVKPEREVFEPGAVARLYWVVTDAWGNEIADTPGTLSAPEGGVTLRDEAEHKYRLDDEGRYTFSVALSPPNEGLSDELTLLVDGSAPELVITWPERGATIEGDGSPVVVEGTISDAWSGLTFFKINGQPVAVGADGAFSHPIEPKWGLNLIEAVAQDGGGHEVRITPTYQYSQAFLPFVDADAEGLKHEDGLVVLLGQDFLDDGVHDHAHVDDMATLFEVLIGDLDVVSLIESSLAGVEQTIPLADYDWHVGGSAASVNATLQGDLQIAVTAVETSDIGPTSISIDSREGGLDFDLLLGDEVTKAVDIDLTLSATASFDLYADACTVFGCTEVLHTQLFGDATLFSGLAIDGITIVLHTNISKQPGGALEVSYEDFDFHMDTLNIDPIQDVVFSLGVVDFPLVGTRTLSFPLSNFIDLNSVIGGLLDPLMSIFTDLLPPLLNPLIEGLVESLIPPLFDLLAIDTSFELPPLLGEREQRFFLDFYTALSSVAFTDDGGTVGLSAGFYADKGVDRDPLGAIQRAGCLKNIPDTLDWGWDPSVGFGMRTDMVNSALFASWWSGFLDGPISLGDLGAGGGMSIPIDNIELTLRWLLPPIINDCGKGDGLLQVGDLYMILDGEMMGSPITLTLYADLALGAGFVTSEEGLSLRIGQLLFADFEVIEQDAGTLGDAFDLETLVEDAIPGLISDFLVGQEFGPFTLPATDLSTLVPGVAAGTTLGLGNLSVTHQDGYILVGGDLE